MNINELGKWLLVKENVSQKVQFLALPYHFEGDCNAVMEWQWCISFKVAQEQEDICHTL